MLRVARWSVCLMLCLVAGAAAAATDDPVEEAIGRYNMRPAFHKLGRGVGNVLTGWMEIPKSMQEYHVRSNPVASVTTGVVHGTVRGVARTAVGAYETLFFWLPYPEEFAPILPPLDYFTPRPRPTPIPAS